MQLPQQNGSETVFGPLHKSKLKKHITAEKTQYMFLNILDKFDVMYSETMFFNKKAYLNVYLENIQILKCQKHFFLCIRTLEFHETGSLSSITKAPLLQRQRLCRIDLIIICSKINWIQFPRYISFSHTYSIDDFDSVNSVILYQIFHNTRFM